MQAKFYLLVIKLYHVAAICLPLPLSRPFPSTTTNGRSQHVMGREESGSQSLDELGRGGHAAEVRQSPVEPLQELDQQTHWPLLPFSILCCRL